MRRHAPVLLMQIGVTHSRGGDLNQHLPRPRTRSGHLLDAQRLPDGVQQRSLHLVLPDPCVASGCCEANPPLHSLQAASPHWQGQPEANVR